MVQVVEMDSSHPDETKVPEEEVEVLAAVTVEDLEVVGAQVPVTIFKREVVLEEIAADILTKMTEVEVGGASAVLVHVMISRKDNAQEVIPAGFLTKLKEAVAEAEAEAVAAAALVVVQALATTSKKANAPVVIDVDTLTMMMEVVVVVGKVVVGEVAAEQDHAMTFKREHALVATGVDLVMTRTVVEVVEAEVTAEEGEEIGMIEETAETAGDEGVGAKIAEGLAVLTGEDLVVMDARNRVVLPGLEVTPDRKVQGGDEKFRRSFVIGFLLQDPEVGAVADATDHEVETAPGSGHADQVETALGSGQEDDDGPGRGTGIETESHQSIRKMRQLLTIRKH